MKWIKVSDKFPDGRGPFVVRRISTGKVWSAHNNPVGTSPFRNYKSKDLEWLDESSQPSTAKWSDSDVKKFLEDYRVANMDCYLNPVIWFDKLNDEK